MSYTSGLGTLQQAYSPVDVSGAGKTTAPAKTETGTLQAPTRSTSTFTLGGDHAKLSSTGGLISKALAGSDVRFEKVAALQQQISAGTYHVSSSDVADKVVGALLK